MVSAGLDTVPGNIIMGMAYLSTKEGQAIQAKALQAIQDVYPDGDAWEKCLVEEKVPYVTALVKETLRFWTVIPICLPRTNIKDIPYKDSVVPAGTVFFMVSTTSLPTSLLPQPIMGTYFDAKVNANNAPRMLTRLITMNLDISFLTNSFPSDFWKTQRLAHRITLMVQDPEFAPASTLPIESFIQHIFDSSQASRSSRLMILCRLPLLMPLNAIACLLR
jgi:hypothetical protein